MRKVVYILLVTQREADGVQIAVGPVCWTRLDASQAAQTLERPGVTVQVIERNVRGDMPEMRTTPTARPAYPERGE